MITGVETMTKKTTILKNDLLFHPTHGLCRVATVTRSSGSSETTYCLLPAVTSHANIRFIIPSSSFENSGFNKLITLKDAQGILKFLKNGNKKNSGTCQAWELAAFIYSQAFCKDPLKDARSRQKLTQAVQGLVREMALVLSLSPFEIAQKIRGNFGPSSAINPLLLLALTSISED